MSSIKQTTPTSLKADLRTEFDSRRREFRRLHSEGCFVIPNPWDIGSARYLQKRWWKQSSRSRSTSWLFTTLDSGSVKLKNLV